MSTEIHQNLLFSTGFAVSFGVSTSLLCFAFVGFLLVDIGNRFRFSLARDCRGRHNYWRSSTGRAAPPNSSALLPGVPVPV